MVRGFIGNEVPVFRLRVRLPCLPRVKYSVWFALVLGSRDGLINRLCGVRFPDERLIQSSCCAVVAQVDRASRSYREGRAFNSRRRLHRYPAVTQLDRVPGFYPGSCTFESCQRGLPGFTGFTGVYRAGALTPVGCVSGVVCRSTHTLYYAVRMTT